jgi:colanic acid biosynthesis glycosyl transferase WcaI
VHDFGGYPFTVELARELADRGHEVLYLCAGGFRKPKGPIEHRSGDPANLSLSAVSLNEPLRPAGFLRVTQERRYGRLLRTRMEEFQPQVVVSTNAPLYVQAAASAQADKDRAAFVFWLQDVHSVAIGRITGRRVKLFGSLIGGWFRRIERSLLLHSDRIVAISESYLPAIAGLGVPMQNVDVIENWAPLEEGAPAPKVNEWSRENGLHDRPVLLYAGTLALKHNPRLLLELARAVREATVVVVSEGQGAEWLRANAGGIKNLRVLPFQPHDRLADMLATSDILLAVLEDDASTFSVPSKILTYFAAGRAILAALPADNPAARAIMETGAGAVVDPGDAQGMIAVAQAMLADPDRLRAAGEAARRHARAKFAIGPIADRFEGAIGSALGGTIDGPLSNDPA